MSLDICRQDYDHEIFSGNFTYPWVGRCGMSSCPLINSLDNPDRFYHTSHVERQTRHELGTSECCCLQFTCRWPWVEWLWCQSAVISQCIVYHRLHSLLAYIVCWDHSSVERMVSIFFDMSEQVFYMECGQVLGCRIVFTNSLCSL